MTLTDVRKFSSKKQIGTGGYSQEQSEASWELVNMQRGERATVIEKYVADQIEQWTGYQANTTRANWPWDITVHLDNKPVRVEVKSAIQRKGTEGIYVVQNIKPDLFDYIVLALVTPTGVELRWSDSLYIGDECWNKNEGRNGYNVSISVTKLQAGKYDEWLWNIEDFPGTDDLGRGLVF